MGEDVSDLQTGNTEALYPTKDQFAGKPHATKLRELDASIEIIILAICGLFLGYLFLVLIYSMIF